MKMPLGASESPKGLTKIWIAGPTGRELEDSAGLGEGPRICISNEFPGNADIANPGTHFENHCLRPHFKPQTEGL